MKLRPKVQTKLQEVRAIARALWDKYRTEPAFDDYQKAKGRWDAAR